MATTNFDIFTNSWDRPYNKVERARVSERRPRVNSLIDKRFRSPPCARLINYLINLADRRYASARSIGGLNHRMQLSDRSKSLIKTIDGVKM